MNIKKEYEKFFERKKTDLCVHNTEDVIEFAKHYQALQLQQTGVIKLVCEIEKEFEGCPLFKQYDNGCYGCKYRKQTVL
jgi:hypothetical protein